METLRKPYQGVCNIFRFNWHFYAAAMVLTFTFWTGVFFVSGPAKPILIGLGILSLIPSFSSLLVSHYIYDLSELYRNEWLQQLGIAPEDCIANISAGFDETSDLLIWNYPKATISRFDFYDAEKHTEIAIERARKLYPQNPSAIRIKSDAITLESNSLDKIIVVFSAHEIRNPQERIDFLKELQRILKENGRLIIVEHLRDLPNFLAFNIGYFHFYSKKNWQHSFEKANLKLTKEFKTTPFISTFILRK